MKGWLIVFAFIFAGGLFALYFGSKRVSERAAHARAIATWEKRAKVLTADLNAESRANEWTHPAYTLARFHLDQAPDGANTRDLKYAVESARNERDSYIKVKARH